MSLGKRSRFALPVVFLALTALTGGVWHFTSVAEEPTGAKPQDMSHAASLSRAFRDAAKAAIPTVVTIRVQSKPSAVTPRADGENPFKGTPLEDFFGEGGRVPRFTPRRSGVGSGVIIDKSGLILTNNHVVEGADSIVVELSDGREFKAEDVKTDPQTDLAVIRIKDAGDLPAAKLGNSEKLQIGDWVIAIGNPFEQQNTVSAGIISGTGRELSSSRARFIQTDAAINPGNSGGPLLNLEGEVVGINTAIASNSGGYQGIGFAIPIDTARWVLDQLVQKGSVQRAYLGVQIRDLDSDLAEQFAVARNEGVLVSQVLPNTPAAEAGFQEGDIITTFAGKKVHEPRELQELVERVPFDSKQEVTVLRDGKTQTLTVVVKPLPKDLASTESPSSPAAPDANKSYSNSKLGLGVSDLGPDEAKQLGFKDLSGALVTSVDADGLAATKGIREGMLIRRVGKTTINNRADFEKAVNDANADEGVLLLVRTPQGQQFFVVLKPEN